METPILKKQYNETVVPALKEKFNIKNAHCLPSITKVVINSGFSATADKNHVKYVNEEITKISGQHAVTTKAKLSISNFKLREGQPIGCKVTLRGRVMYDFLARLINIALPCIRDFRGIPAKLDGNGNYTLGVSDHSIFPEVSAEGNTALIGMDISINTSAKTDELGKELLSQLGMPFRKSSSELEAAESKEATSEATEA
jgi:large subunit ribosomal protein L5|tara:strand:- start:2740 stop:3339 length:600 start_codon:yes stop_codon:yes gene_type:complete